MNYQHYISVFTEFLRYVQSHWTTIAAYSVGGLTIASVLQLLKKKFKLNDLPTIKYFKLIKLDAPKVIVALFSLFTLIGTVADYAISAHVQSPNVIPKNFAYLLGAAFFIHRFMVSPAFTAVEKYVATSPYFGAVKELKSAKAEAAQPKPSIFD